MMVFSLALRNLLRNRRRSLMTLSAMVVGLVSMLIFGGYARNAILSTQTGYVQYHGHLQIQRKGYFLYGSGNPVAYGISDYQRIIDVVKKDPVLQPMLVVVTPSLRLNGIAGNFSNGVSKGVVAAGVVVDDQNKMRKWDEYDSLSYAPPIALSGTAADSAVIGTGVARLLQMCAPLKLQDCPSVEQTGAPDGAGGNAPAAPANVAALSALEQASAPQAGATGIELLAASVRGAPNVAALNVVRAENWGVKEIDDSLIIMHLDQAQRLVFGGAAPQVTAIQIQLAHTAQIPAARARLDQLLASEFKGVPLEILDYETLTPIYKQVIQFFDSIFGFMSILIYVIVLFTVGNTMSMAVVERTAEIGTLRAIGQRHGGIRSLFVCEGVLLGLIGAVLGIVIALPIAYVINHSGLTWAPPGYSYEYPLMVRVWGDNRLMFGTAFSLAIVAVISAWWPANRAAKLNIVDALRHV
ncbi:ABC transporter permease [Janthinobacterium fluminis]|uniref:FtsX-like permease family protein n=1 Tax=Janthinobacterium fluminis TaxID=2987524 RepID=A0ABT5K2D7_9BURK|nr:FtsX-like permease family protein [Janthinobacterium fluminis]MDC8758426.1 FtsX-like permease family protein [Janthinobacterium fluminis]